MLTYREYFFKSLSLLTISFMYLFPIGFHNYTSLYKRTNTLISHIKGQLCPGLMIQQENSS